MEDVQLVEPSSAEEGAGILSSGAFNILRILWVHRCGIAKTVAAGVLLSAVLAFRLPTMYTSITTLMPPESSSPNSNLMSLLSSAGPTASLGGAMLGAKSSGAVFVGLLRSRTVQNDLVGRFDLLHYYNVQLVEDASRNLAADTNVQEDQKSGIITVSVSARDPQLASRIARGYVEELDRAVTSNSTSAARRERTFLEGRLTEIKHDLDDSARALSQFSATSRTIDLPSQGKAMVEAGLKLQSELAVARSEWAGLRQTYSDDNVRVRTASARVEELQRQLDKITGPTGKTGSTADANGTDYPSLERLPALGLTYADLDRKVLVEEALWGALTKQYEAAKVQEAKEIPTVRVLDAANVPQHKSSPVRSAIVILGAMASFLMACVTALLHEAWENLAAGDERKELINEIAASARASLKGIWNLPGIIRACAGRLRRPKSESAAPTMSSPACLQADSRSARMGIQA